MFVYMHKLLIEQNLPLRMKQFTAAVCHEGTTWCFAPILRSSKIFK
jgi:hypothetical protein